MSEIMIYKQRNGYIGANTDTNKKMHYTEHRADTMEEESGHIYMKITSKGCHNTFILRHRSFAHSPRNIGPASRTGLNTARALLHAYGTQNARLAVNAGIGSVMVSLRGHERPSKDRASPRKIAYCGVTKNQNAGLWV